MTDAAATEPREHHDAKKEPLEAVVDDAIDCAEGDEVSLGNLLHAWGDRSYGPLFIVLGFFAGTPLAVVPMAAAVVGIVIALLAAQMALGKRHPWLPGFMLNWSAKEERLIEMRDKAGPVLGAVDRVITERLTFFAGKPMRTIAAIIIMALGVLMTPFDAVPFAVAAPAWTVVLFGVAITARDGLVMALAILACGGIGYLGYSML